MLRAHACGVSEGLPAQAFTSGLLTARRHGVVVWVDEFHEHRLPPLAMVPVGLRDDNVAPRDPVIKVLEMIDVLECRVADGLVDRDVVERDLGLGLHGGPLRRFLKNET